MLLTPRKHYEWVKTASDSELLDDWMETKQGSHNREEFVRRITSAGKSSLSAYLATSPSMSGPVAPLKLVTKDKLPRIPWTGLAQKVVPYVLRLLESGYDWTRDDKRFLEHLSKMPPETTVNDLVSSMGGHLEDIKTLYHKAFDAENKKVG